MATLEARRQLLQWWATLSAPTYCTFVHIDHCHAPSDYWENVAQYGSFEPPNAHLDQYAKGA